MKQFAVAAVLATTALGLVACGSDTSSSSKDSSNPALALKEVGETRTALEAALVTYRAGDKAKAEDQVSEAYLQHFEEVEGPLGKVDADLKESLEKAISTDLRTKMKSGSSADVEALAKQIMANLTKAEAALR